MKKVILLLVVLTFPFISFRTAYAQNYVLDFGGFDDFKFVMVGPDTHFDTDGITVEDWIKPTDLPTGHYIYGSAIIWNLSYAPGQDPYIFYINKYSALEAYADFQDGGFGEFIISTTPVSLNEWHHVALIIDPTRMALSIDGNLVEELRQTNRTPSKIYGHRHQARERPQQHQSLQSRQDPSRYPLHKRLRCSRSGRPELSNLWSYR